MTPIELHRLAAAITCLRPDWPANSLQTFLERHLSHRPLHDIAVALTYVATDPHTQTPARVLEAGPWWHAASTTDHPRTVNDCPQHATGDVTIGLRTNPRTGATECAGCYADRHEGDQQTARFNRRPIPATARELLDGLLRATATPNAATRPAPATQPPRKATG